VARKKARAKVVARKKSSLRARPAVVDPATRLRDGLSSVKSYVCLATNEDLKCELQLRPMVFWETPDTLQVRCKLSIFNRGNVANQWDMEKWANKRTLQFTKKSPLRVGMEFYETYKFGKGDRKVFDDTVGVIAESLLDYSGRMGIPIPLLGSWECLVNMLRKLTILLFIEHGPMEPSAGRMLSAATPI
jgi:hypothetical protein